MRKVLQFIARKFKKWAEEPVKKPVWFKVAKRVVDKDLEYGIIDIDTKITKRDAKCIVKAEEILDRDAKKIFYSLPINRSIKLSKRIILKRFSKTA